MDLRRLIAKREDATPTRNDDTVGTPLLDPMGEAFDLLRAGRVDLGIWRAELFEVTSLGQDQVVLVAVYDARDLEHAAHVVERHPTIVVGMGIGEWLGSRALSLGALGYLHDALEAPALRGRVADALARHRYRRSRAQVALATPA